MARLGQPSMRSAKAGQVGLSQNWLEEQLCTDVNTKGIYENHGL